MMVWMLKSSLGSKPFSLAISPKMCIRDSRMTIRRRIDPEERYARQVVRPFGRLREHGVHAPHLRFRYIVAAQAAHEVIRGHAHGRLLQRGVQDVYKRQDEHFSRRTLVCHEEGQHASREHEVGEAHPCSRIAARQHYHEHAA